MVEPSPPQEQSWAANGSDNLPPGVWHLASGPGPAEPPTPVHNGPPIVTTPPAGIPVSSGHSGGIPLPPATPVLPVASAPPVSPAQPYPMAPPVSPAQPYPAASPVSPAQPVTSAPPAPPEPAPAPPGPTSAPPAPPGPMSAPPAQPGPMQAAPPPPPGWGQPPAGAPAWRQQPANQPLQPPADPWAGTAPLPHAPESPWSAPPASHTEPPTQPTSQAPREVHPGVTEVPQQPQPEAPGVYRMPPQAYAEQTWTPDVAVPTAEEFARRRAARPPEPVARTGVRAAVNKSTLGLVRLAPGRHEQEFRQDVEKVRRNFGGLRQVTVVNPKGGAGKTVAVLLLAMTFGQKRGGYVLAWDNNETQGTLGMRAQQDFHTRTVRDMLRDLSNFQGARGRVGDLSQYVRSQGEGMFDVLASDESATAGEMLTAHAFAEIREVVSRFYKLIFVDTGNNVRAQNWQAAIDATDQLVVTMSARNDSAETAARMLDHLEQSGRTRLVRQAVTVVSMPPRAKDIDLPPIQRHFAARTRAVLVAPYERLIDTGEPLRYGQLSTATQDAWLRVAAAVSEGL
jgi:MinD-like ATPase involved in chromosome partitioning or flagellar assembly